MTWVFGILSVTDAGLVFQYIFTILNSLQVHHLPMYVLRTLGFLCSVLNVVYIYIFTDATYHDTYNDT